MTLVSLVRARYDSDSESLSRYWYPRIAYPLRVELMNVLRMSSSAS